MTINDLLDKWIKEAWQEHEIAKKETNAYKMLRLKHIINVIIKLK